MTHPTRAFSGSIINRFTGSKILARVGQISVAFPDAKYIDLYADYRRMLANGDKVSYIVTILSNKYAVSERKVYGLIKHFQSDCKLFAV